ncbi:hypothetical protein Tco_0885954 [Tanacetum coccineum]
MGVDGYTSSHDIDVAEHGSDESEVRYGVVRQSAQLLWVSRVVYHNVSYDTEGTYSGVFTRTVWRHNATRDGGFTLDSCGDIRTLERVECDY